jgi:hypothetical protein
MISLLFSPPATSLKKRDDFVYASLENDFICTSGQKLNMLISNEIVIFLTIYTAFSPLRIMDAGSPQTRTS